MNTQLVGLLLLSLAAVGLYYQNDITTLEAQQPNTEFLGCTYGGVLWRLEDVNLHNDDILKMVAMMDAGKLTELCQEQGHDVEEIFLYLNHNPNLTDFSPLLEAINRNYSETIYNIQMDFGYNKMEDWDKNFKNWQIPPKVVQVVFSFKDNQSATIQNFTNSVVSQGKINKIYLDATDNGVSGQDIQNLVTAIQNQKQINQKVQLFFGYNLEGDTESVKQGFVDIIKNSPNLFWVEYWLQEYSMTEEYLEELSQVIYDRKVEGTLNDVTLNLMDCGVSASKVRQIFKKPLDKMGFRFHLIV